jgi:hypothetical protein
MRVFACSYVFADPCSCAYILFFFRQLISYVFVIVVNIASSVIRLHHYFFLCPTTNIYKNHLYHINYVAPWSEYFCRETLAMNHGPN